MSNKYSNADIHRNRSKIPEFNENPRRSTLTKEMTFAINS